MTLNDLRNTFSGETRFFLQSSYTEEEFEINNLLWGTPGFADMTFSKAKAASKNIVVIRIGLPYRIFEAYKEYSKGNDEN